MSTTQALLTRAKCFSNCIPRGLQGAVLLSLIDAASFAPVTPPGPPPLVPWPQRLLIWTATPATGRGQYATGVPPAFLLAQSLPYIQGVDANTITGLQWWWKITAPNYTVSVSNINTCPNLRSLIFVNQNQLISISDLEQLKFLNYVFLAGCTALPQAMIDYVLLTLDNGGSPYVNGGLVNYNGTVGPSAAGQAAANDLANNHGWTITP